MWFSVIFTKNSVCRFYYQINCNLQKRFEIKTNKQQMTWGLFARRNNNQKPKTPWKKSKWWLFKRRKEVNLSVYHQFKYYLLETLSINIFVWLLFNLCLLWIDNLLSTNLTQGQYSTPLVWNSDNLPRCWICFMIIEWKEFKAHMKEQTPYQ